MNQIRKSNYSACIRAIKMTTRHNVLKVHAHNTYDHEKLKFDIVYLLRKNGHNIATEVEFKKGGRADILDLDEAVVYEVLKTESLEAFEEKKSYYPGFLTIIAVPVESFKDKFFDLIKFLGVD